ncbi:SRPBCC family protein [Gorillibacterium massiliense]|uniref:SRPBCC family protein n=1 Tax=Gorillibacterium massiliense TaxID=1280390 RepID=UPI0004B38467|nr:SRPBCC domain-containing protein [Gorillibacterium massiliense]
MENNANKLEDIKQVVVFNAPIEKVWAAVSTSEGIASWFMPNDFQPVVGHEFHLQSPFGPSPCKVTEFDPPHRLSFSWDRDGWVLTMELKDLGGETEFTLTHGGWQHADFILSTGMKSTDAYNNMAGGWKGIVGDRLKQVVEG